MQNKINFPLNPRNFLNTLLLLNVFVLGSCVSSGDSQQPSDKQGAVVDVPSDPAVESVTREQALSILERSEKYLNPISTAPSGQDGLNKALSIPHEGASESPRNDGIHDNFNNSIVTLQDPTKALADFPRDRRNQVDWVAALGKGHIEPRADLRGKSKMQTMDLDIIMKNTQYMPWVRFPHLPHTKWLACSNCHPDIFVPKENANPITMNKVLRGQYCGVCHDKVAFAIFICERCHSVPHEGSGKKWW